MSPRYCSQTITPSSTIIRFIDVHPVRRCFRYWRGAWKERTTLYSVMVRGAHTVAADYPPLAAPFAWESYYQIHHPFNMHSSCSCSHRITTTTNGLVTCGLRCVAIITHSIQQIQSATAVMICTCRRALFLPSLPALVLTSPLYRDRSYCLHCKITEATWWQTRM